MFSASLYVSARGGHAKNDFGLDIADTHASGCLIVKDATGKAAECGIRKFDLICLARGMDLTVRSMHALTDSTPCDIFTVRFYSVPCLSIPVNSRIDVGLKLKMEKLKLRQHDPSKLSNHFIVESVTTGSVASNHPISPGDWILSINGLLLSRRSLDEVQVLLKGDGRSTLELCTWSNPMILSNSPDSEKYEIDWIMDPRLGGFLTGCVIGGVVILLFFWRKKKKTAPQQQQQLPVDLGNDGSPEERLYAQDTCRILKIISKDCPRFDLPDNKIQMIPADRSDFRIRKANPSGDLELCNPFGDLEFEVIDYGVSFNRFLSFLSTDNSDDRQYLDKLLGPLEQANPEEQANPARQSNRCLWLHLGVLLKVHPFALQTCCRLRCKDLDGKKSQLPENLKVSLFQEPDGLMFSVLKISPGSDSSCPYQNDFVDATVLPWCWPQEMDRVRLLLVKIQQSGGDSKNKNALHVFCPRLKAQQSEGWTGPEFILKLQGGHFTILKPKDKALGERCIDALLSHMRTLHDFDSEDRLWDLQQNYAFYHLENEGTGYHVDAVRCLSAQELYDKVVPYHP